jgi:hypothetical protein
MRAKRILAALLIGLGLALIASTYVNDDPGAILNLGDLPGFYGLGRIVVEGRGALLYDFALQRDIQNHFWPQLAGSSFPTMYPPVVGLVMAPLSLLPPPAVHGILAATSFFLLCALVRWQSPDRQIERFGLILFSVPTLVSIVAPQTTILSLLFITACRHFLLSAKNFGAGVCAGLLLYKPQIGVPFILIAGAGGGATFYAGTFLSALGLYSIGVFVVGGEWVLPWVEKIQEFSVLRRSVEAFQFTAITGGVAPYLFTGSWAGATQIVVAMLGLALCAVMTWRQRSQFTARDSAITLFLTTYAAFVPQTIFYDLAIPLFALFTSISLSNKRALYQSILVAVLVNACTFIRSPSLSLVPVAALIIALFSVRSRSWPAS